MTEPSVANRDKVGSFVGDWEGAWHSWHMQGLEQTFVVGIHATVEADMWLLSGNLA